MQASAPASHSWPEHVQATVFFQAQELEQATKEASYSEPDHVLYKNLHELQSHRSLSSSIHRTSIYISSNSGVTVRTSLSSHSYSTARTNNFTSLRFRASAGSSYKSYSSSRAYMPAYFQSQNMLKQQPSIKLTSYNHWANLLLQTKHFKVRALVQVLKLEQAPTPSLI